MTKELSQHLNVIIMVAANTTVLKYCSKHFIFIITLYFEVSTVTTSVSQMWKWRHRMIQYLAQDHGAAQRSAPRHSWLSLVIYGEKDVACK